MYLVASGDDRARRVHRISFSKSLLRHVIAAGRRDGYLLSGKIVVGRELRPGEASKSGLYAVVKARSGWPLRVCMFQRLADHWRHPSRRVHECWVDATSLRPVN